MLARPAGLLLGASLLLAAAPALAIGSVEKGDYSLEAIGGARLTGVYLHYPDVPLFFPETDSGLAAAVLRLLLDGDLGPYVDYDVNLYADFSYAPAALTGGTFATVGSFETPYRTTYLSWDFLDSRGMEGQMGVDRFSFNLEVDRVSLTFGRFPVNYTTTNIFTPNDFFAPFSPTAINQMYKPGVDAIQMGVTTGMLSTVELVGVMGYGTDDVPAWGRSALLARLSTILWNFEWALLGGKVAERWIVGASLQGELGPFGVRAEGHAGFPDAHGDFKLDDHDRDGGYLDDIHGRLAVGFDYMHAWQNLSISAEYMYVSDGADRTSLYLTRFTSFYPDDVPFMGRHYVGLSAGLEIIPILRFNAMALFNTTDYSGLASMMLLYNIADEIDAMLGVLVPWGEEPVEDLGPPTHEPSIESEFGLMPLMLFLEMRFYF
ncbi:MAG: hypothetical protein JRG91_13955 [Deltaproteobacteria bacterium]|nr:hypothetical protein [Deltaproteobacteria bacterium]